jgi:hypothetical protein
MDITKEFADYLQTAGFGTVGTDIFVGQIPSSINGVYVIRTAGTLDNYLPVERTVMNIYVKDTSSLDAVHKIESIKHYVHRMHNTTTPGSYIFSMLALGDIETVERDVEYTKIYKLTIEITHRYLGIIS